MKAPADRNETLNKGSNKAAENLDQGFLDTLVGYHLRRAQFIVFNDFKRTVADHNITPGQFGVLMLIALNPGLTQSALSRAVGVERSTMVAVIDNLEGQGLVERRASPQDRRSYALVLTDKGARTQKELELLVLQHDDRIAGHLDDREKETLITLLQRLGGGG